MDTDSALKFGQRITRYRKRRGWSQIQAARVMQVQRTSLNRWEKGHEMPSCENMTKLRDHLQMPIGTNEEATEVLNAQPGHQNLYQLALAFDQPIELELRVMPQKADSVQFQVRLKDIAG